MGLRLFVCEGGEIVLPDRNSVLVDRRAGGTLIVNPPRAVWERSELTAAELTQWSFLVAAAGRAMLDVLPQLEGGCVNYWDAGNWALNDQADPAGPKAVRNHRQVHLHLLGRSRTSTDPAWRWGEAPNFPTFAERHAWAAGNERLSAAECGEIVMRAESLMQAQYGMQSGQTTAWKACSSCAYPTPLAPATARSVCAECQQEEARR